MKFYFIGNRQDDIKKYVHIIRIFPSSLTTNLRIEYRIFVPLLYSKVYWHYNLCHHLLRWHRNRIREDSARNFQIHIDELRCTKPCLYHKMHIECLDHDEHPNQELKLYGIKTLLIFFWLDRQMEIYRWALYFSIAVLAVMTTLLNRQKPFISFFIAWWPGGRTSAKPFRH